MLGTRDDVLRINNFCTHTFYVSYIIHDIPKNFSWKMVVVYDPAYEEKRAEFIDELHSIMSGWQGPILFGGDFNLCRIATDKSNSRINKKYVYCFNDGINKWGLIELDPSNRKFTWTNNQRDPILAKLDRIFVSTSWESAFPLVRVTTLPKDISDYNPILVDSSTNFSCGKNKFRFEKWWLERPDFKDVVTKAWNTSCSNCNPVEVLLFKVRTLRRLVRGWADNVVTELNKHKQSIAVVTLHITETLIKSLKL
jgi:hypothetical protein